MTSFELFEILNLIYKCISFILTLFNILFAENDSI